MAKKKMESSCGCEIQVTKTIQKGDTEVVLMLCCMAKAMEKADGGTYYIVNNK